MREMKDSGVAWIGEIPEEWDLLRFKDHYKNIKEVAGEKSFEYDRLALTLNGVIKRKKDDSDGLQPKEFDGYQILRKNDFIFKMIDLQNISTSRVGLSQYTGLVSPAYIRFTPRKKDSFNKFVYYYLMSMYYNCVFNNLGGNGVRSALNASDMGRLMIPYPKIETQHQIATYLDQKCTQIDALIANQQKQIEKLKAYKQSLITETVTKGLNPDVPMKDSGVEWIGEIPEDWEIIKYGKICKVKSNLVHPSEYLDYIQVAPDNIEKGSGKLLPCLTVKENGIVSDNHLFFKGQLLYSKIRPILNKVTIAPFDGLCSADIYPIETNQDYRYMMYFMLSNLFLVQVKMFTENRVKMPKINQEELAQITSSIPPIEEQQAIVSYLDKKCTQIDSLIAIKQRKIEKLQQYKKSVIYEYVTGKKEVK